MDLVEKFLGERFVPVCVSRTLNPAVVYLKLPGYYMDKEDDYRNKVVSVSPRTRRLHRLGGEEGKGSTVRGSRCPG